VALWWRPVQGTERGEVAGNWSTRQHGRRLTTERRRWSLDGRCRSAGGFNSRVEDDASMGDGQVGDIA
jgi:hypothetical protein